MEGQSFFYNFLTLKEPEYYEEAAKALVLILADALKEAGLDIVDTYINYVKYQANWDGDTMLYPNLLCSITYQASLESGLVSLNFPIQVEIESYPLRNYFRGKLSLGTYNILEKVYKFSPEIDFYSLLGKSVRSFIQENLFKILSQINGGILRHE